MERVKYFSNTDMSTGYNLRNSEKILNDFDISKQYNINEMLEFYNIILLIKKNKVYLKKWNKMENINYQNICKDMESYIAKEIKNITDYNFNSLYKKTYFEYREDIFAVINMYKIYEELKFETLKKLFNVDGGIPINMLLKYKNIVAYWDKDFSDCLLDDPLSAEILLDKYAVQEDCIKKEINIPASLTLEQKETIINDYIVSDRANLNYINAIINMKVSKEFNISSQTKLNAKKKQEELTKSLFENSSGFKYGCDVSFVKNQKEAVEYESGPPMIKVNYSENWVKDNLDFATLLNNFIYLFEYCDKQFRLSIVSKTNDLGLFEKHMGIKVKNEYKFGIAFNQMNMLTHLQLYHYYNVLKNHLIRLEDIIEWFFKDYLLDEFKIENYIIDMPSENSTYLEKCRSIAAEIETIIKSYHLYNEKGEIDLELLDLISTPPYGTIKSKINKKYIYGNSETYYRLAYLFFSDQCMLGYSEKAKKKDYQNFCSRIISEKITKEDIVAFENENLQWLLENKYLLEDENGILEIADKKVLLIIKDLFENEVINYWRNEPIIRNKIDEMINDKILYEENTLFTKLETDYFNYFLNNSGFGNALALRNEYLHGSKKGKDVNGAIHKYNYFILLRIVILIIIKINDDLCIYEDNQLPSDFDS